MVKYKEFSRHLSVFQVLFKANLNFKVFSRQSLILKDFSSMWDSCENSVVANQSGSKEEGKDQESIQSSTTPDPGPGLKIVKWQTDQDQR